VKKGICIGKGRLQARQMNGLVILPRDAEQERDNRTSCFAREDGKFV